MAPLSDDPEIVFRLAKLDQVDDVLGVLNEAAAWLQDHGIAQWPARFEPSWIEEAILQANRARLRPGSDLFGIYMGVPLTKRSHGYSLVTPDVIVISHVHLDHLHVPSLRRFGPGTRIIVPAGAGRLLGRKGFKNVDEARAGDTFAVTMRKPIIRAFITTTAPVTRAPGTTSR